MVARRVAVRTGAPFLLVAFATGCGGSSSSSAIGGDGTEGPATPTGKEITASVASSCPTVDAVRKILPFILRRDDSVEPTVTAKLSFLCVSRLGRGRRRRVRQLFDHRLRQSGAAELRPGGQGARMLQGEGV